MKPDAWAVVAVAALLGCSGVHNPTADRAPDADVSMGVSDAEDTVQDFDGETPEGWHDLFDGRTLAGWRGFGRDDPPADWRVEDGTIALVPGEGGGDLMTVDVFGDFELRLEWRISPGGNSGIFYRVSEQGRTPYETGPEMQVLDNEGHSDGQRAETSAGACYDLYGPSSDATRPVGEWNAVRIVARGAHVEHWMNGTQLLSYEIGSEDWLVRLAASKLAELPLFAVAREGHIALQDHGDPVWYRRIAVRLLD